MTVNPTILSLQGKGLKLNTRADIEPYLRDVDPAIVEEIHFGGNTVGIEAAEALAEFLEKTQVLKVRLIAPSVLQSLMLIIVSLSTQVADFADIFTGRLITEIPQALSAICDALKNKTSLVEINLSDNAFGGRSVDPMVPFLTTNRSFQILKLNNNGLGPAGGAIIADALLQSAKLSKKEGKPSNLRVVICGRNRLEDGSASVWAEAFREHAGLTEIRMPQNGIRMDGISALVRGISECKGLQYLDLQDNTFGELGSETMSGVLGQWPHLHTLNLSDCHLAEEGDVSPVVTVLAGGSNLKLQTLQLQNNNFDAQSFALLAEGIDSALGALKRLELQWNEIEEEDEGILALSRALKARRGKLIVDDEEDEEEEEETEETEKEETKEEVKPAQPAQAKSLTDQATDALADLLNKVSIRS
ncbi:hypothetical protein EW026_g2314 [Hermanssonia centrifuga]|uniref:Ran GTPase activating protein 1 n=1 Tax=Hermanssonia centrifuga TaxID=98765 RepID=A0A4S4KPP3_9APHY|nr:hypothetical protein EW026_g2314 [Hermanssonia centrifuga]